MTKTKTKTTKRILCVMLCFVTAFCTIPMSVWADDEYTYTDDDGNVYTYTISDTDEITITGFSEQTAVSTIIIPSIIDGYTVTTIGHKAFFKCIKKSSTSVTETSLVIPSTISSIESSALAYNKKLVQIIVDENNKQFSSVDGVLFNKKQTELLTYPTGLSNLYYTIPDSVITIGDYAFYSCDSLTSITIPDSVITIGDYAFGFCDFLTSITIPDSVITIGDSAFYSCDSFTSITIPDSVITIGDHAFYYCPNLLSVVVSSSVTSLGEHAFDCCYNLNLVVILSSNVDLSYNMVSSDKCITTFISISQGNCPVNLGLDNSEDVVIYGIGGSSLNTYATHNDLTFVAIDYTTTEADCVNDGVITITVSEEADKDVLETLSLSVGDVVWEGTYTPATGEHNYSWTTVSKKPTKKCTVCDDVLVTLKFTDISSSEYKGYYNYIAYTSYYNSYIKGTTSTTFAPKKALTKAALITILYRMAGSPSVSGYSNPYSDVKSTAYYYKAALWAYKKGITTDTTFDGSEAITREKTVTYLYRYAKKFTDADMSTKSISSFPDASSVKSYAVTPMKWAYKNGLITGNSSGNLNPQGKTLRIYASKILYKFGVACDIGNFS